MKGSSHVIQGIAAYFAPGQRAGGRAAQAQGGGRAGSAGGSGGRGQAKCFRSAA